MGFTFCHENRAQVYINQVSFNYMVMSGGLCCRLMAVISCLYYPFPGFTSRWMRPPNGADAWHRGPPKYKYDRYYSFPLRQLPPEKFIPQWRWNLRGLGGKVPHSPLETSNFIQWLELFFNLRKGDFSVYGPGTKRRHFYFC